MRKLGWSYSFLSTYLRCRLQAEARYVTKTYPFKETPEMAKGNKLHTAFEHYVRNAISELPGEIVEEFPRAQAFADKAKSLPMPVAEHQIGIRRDWGPTGFFARDAWGRCKVDFYSMGTESALIWDWKSGKVWEDPLELLIQAVAINSQYPKIKNMVAMYVWLKPGKLGDVHKIGPKEISDTRKLIEDIMAKVEMEPWLATKNALCGWCDYTHCRHYKETRR